MINESRAVETTKNFVDELKAFQKDAPKLEKAIKLNSYVASDNFKTERLCDATALKLIGEVSAVKISPDELAALKG